MSNINIKDIYKLIDQTFNDNIQINNIIIQKSDNDCQYSIYYNGFWYIRIYLNNNISGDVICSDQFKSSCPSIEEAMSDIKSKVRKKKIEKILNDERK